jgi:hypothetical protein
MLQVNSGSARWRWIMRKRWLQAIKRFIEQFTPGGTEYTEDGIAIVYNRWGGMTIPRSEYPKLLAKMSREVNAGAPLLQSRREKEH